MIFWEVSKKEGWFLHNLGDLMKNRYYILNFIFLTSLLSVFVIAQTSEDAKKFQQHLNDGNIAYTRRDFQTAIEYFSQAINIYPKVPQLFFNRGLCYSYIRDYDSAIKDYNKALELNLPKAHKVHLYLNRGIAFRTKGEYTDAIKDFDESISLDQNNWSAFNGRGITYQFLKKYDLAILDLNKSLELMPSHVGFYSLGSLYYQKLDYTNAINNFTKAIGLNAEIAEVYNSRGLSYELNSQPDLALSDLTKAISLKANDGTYYLHRGNVYSQKNNYDFAIQDYSKAIEIYPFWTLAYTKRAEIYMRQRKTNLAEADLQKAKEVEKENFNPYNKVELVEQ